VLAGSPWARINGKRGEPIDFGTQFFQGNLDQLKPALDFESTPTSIADMSLRRNKSRGGPVTSDSNVG